MTILVTGANSFVAQGLIAALAAQGHDLLLTDLSPGHGAGRWMPGDLSDPAHLDALTAPPLSAVVHLASVLSALAESRPDLGRAVNLLAPEGLFHRIARQGRRARVVFASKLPSTARWVRRASTRIRRPRPRSAMARTNG